MNAKQGKASTRTRREYVREKIESEMMKRSAPQTDVSREKQERYMKLAQEGNFADLDELMGGYLRPVSIGCILYQFRRYVLFAGSVDRVFQANTLREYIRYCIAETQLKRDTIDMFIYSVKRVMQVLYRNKRISKETAFDFSEVERLPPNALPERNKRGPRIRLEPESVRTFVRLPEASRTDPIACRDRALFYVLATTGMRIHEVLNIKVGDIQKVGDHFVVTNIMGKGQREPRQAPISRDAVAAVMDWLYVRPYKHEYVFTGPRRYNFHEDSVLLGENAVVISRECARRAIKKYAEKLGIPDLRAHDFRRYVGTQLAKHDIRQAQKVLGHKNIQTTALHYVLDDVPMGVTEHLA